MTAQFNRSYGHARLMDAEARIQARRVCTLPADQHDRMMTNFGLCPSHPETTILPATHPEEDPL